ncbi:DUF6069 family protein [Phytohabitans aurantiacus]|jgi:hypothetical protein|uniref:Uncharacterized protein n=1 Tax=Phytohabitans aurantiacus TaxID=3016789 RepID=A0ABQ5R296_9ACTN|nr:DUF6069 family protein [Phytohabitans aurantiacus]GLI00841.1 hypothetical protein Pa4123_61170 [Phytohabitans aurantiacus]
MSADVSWKSTLAAIGIAIAGSVAANSVIALVARGPLDAPSEFQPLTPGAYVFLTSVGVILGAVVWRLIVARSRNATSVLRWLVPTVVAASLLPDVALLVATESQPGITTAGVVALMLMHIAVAAVAVPTFRRYLPPRT